MTDEGVTAFFCRHTGHARARQKRRYPAGAELCGFYRLAAVLAVGDFMICGGEAGGAWTADIGVHDGGNSPGDRELLYVPGNGRRCWMAWGRFAL